MSWELAIGFIAGEVAGIVIMAILSGRLDRRMDMKEKEKRERQWAEEQGLLYPENKKSR